MNIDNVFDLIFDVVFFMSPQLGGILPKDQDLVLSICLCEGVTLQKLHLRSLQVKSGFFLLNDETE